MKDILKNKLYLEDINKTLDNINLSKLDNRSIIVTGGLGLICSAIVDIIHVYNEKKHKNIKIYVADINEEFFNIRYGEYKDIHYLKYNALEPLSFDVPCDFIIHGAGLASPELFVNKPVETMTSNFIGVKYLLDYALEHKTENFLYISSSEVYGKKEKNDSFIEDAFGICDINTVRASYYEAKRASEVLCRSYASEYGVSTVMVRPGHIYGPTASPRDLRVSSDFAFKAARGEDLELKSSGLTIRSYCYSLDCAVALLYALLYG
ncbi:MAG: NAD-dependent epimerase/dehydratase family protein, partial [Bacilli bacterium]|nr:NAD-dependent epimerase/dehydratase family protein [Bacilli bacterium]